MANGHTGTAAAAAACLCQYCAISVPCIIYCGWQLYAHWDEQYLVKRHRNIVNATYYILAFVMSFEGIAAADELTTLRYITSDFISGIFNTLFMIFMLLGATRFWLLYYDHHYEALLLSKTWQLVIAPESFKNNWFLLKKQTYGDDKYILKSIIVPVVVVRLIMYIPFMYLTKDSPAAHQTILDIDAYGVMILCGIWSCFMLVLWRKYSKFDDDGYFIRHEFRLSLSYCIVAFLILIPVNVAIRTLELSTFWTSLSVQLYLCGFVVIMVVYPRWMLDKETLSIHVRLRQHHQVPAESAQYDDLRGNVREHWQNSISTKKGYERFAAFLANQLSLEVFICICFDAKVMYSVLSFLCFDLLMNRICCL